MRAWVTYKHALGWLVVQMSVDDYQHMIECDRMLSHATRRRFNPALLSRNIRTSARTTMKVIPIPVRSDNYAYLLVDEESKKAAAIDPYDLPKVASSAQGLGVEIVACITTHHHDDHSGGNHVCEFGLFFAEPFRRILPILFHHPQAICRSRLSPIPASFSHSPRCTQADQFPNTPIYGGSEQVKAVTKIVKDADTFTIGSLEVR